MIKKIKACVKLALLAGQATPARPIGPALGQYGINLINFCKEYNLKTSTPELNGYIIPVKITIFEDKTFTFILKSSPVSNLLLKELNLLKGPAKPNKEVIGTLLNDQIRKIALKKLNDLNTKNLDKAISMIKGTAKNMGILIID